MFLVFIKNIDGLVQKKRNSSALAMDFHLLALSHQDYMLLCSWESATNLITSFKTLRFNWTNDTLLRIRAIGNDFFQNKFQVPISKSHVY